jgi:hypothetical protein
VPRVEPVMTLARELAARIVAASFDHLSEQAIRCAKSGVLDTLAVGIAGSAVQPLEQISDVRRLTDSITVARRRPVLTGICGSKGGGAMRR